jgi:hypothetical protein
METTSPETLPPSILTLSSDGVAVGLTAALGSTTACNGYRAAVGFAAASGTTACTGDGAISVAAVSETIASNGNTGNNGDDGDDGEGAAISFAAASGTTAAVTMSQRTAISSDAKSSLQAYFEEEEWLLNRELSKGAGFFSGWLGEIVTGYQLAKMQGPALLTQTMIRWCMMTVKTSIFQRQKKYCPSVKGIDHILRKH